MTVSLDQDTVLAAIKAACRAPSIHNSQPWRFSVNQRRVDVFADYSRWLPATDADARDVLLSCGAVLHHLRVALATGGIQATVQRFPDPTNPDLVATISLDGAATPGTADAQLFPFIAERRSDRRPFRDWPIPDSFVQHIIGRAAEQGATIRVVNDDRSIQVLLEAIDDAAAVQAADPGYRLELATWTGREGDDGIPKGNLLREPAPNVAAARTFSAGDIATPEVEGPESATLMVLGTTSQDRLSKLRAGEALSAVLLQATQFGLATCPLTQPLEVAATRKLLEDAVLGGTLSAQVVLRLGWAPAGPPLPATPRRPVDDVVEPQRN